MSAGPLGPLVGMTFDPVKNRYFPTPPAPKPGSASKSKVPTVRSGTDKKAKKPESDSRRRKRAAVGPEPTAVDQTVLGAQRFGPSHHHVGLSRHLAWKTGDFTAHRSLLRNERYLSLNECEVIGDSQQSSMVTTIHAVPGSSRKIMSGNSQGEVVGFSDQVNPRNMGPFRVTDGLRRYQWRSFNFASSISGVHCEKDYFLATSFGPRPSLVVCPEYPPSFSSTHRYAEQSQRSTTMYNLKQLKDARCMSCKDGTISIGGDGKVLYSRNALKEMGGKFDTLSIKGKSDVMSIEQVNVSEAYAGLRSGGIYHLDFRIPGGLTAVFDAMPNKMPAINLVSLESAYSGGRALLVNRMSSELALYDLRFPGSEAAVKYEGHVNETFEQSMAVAIDRTETTVFAAGTDHRIRAWDRTTGEPIVAANALTESLLGKRFAEPITSILAQNDGSIYVATGRDISVFARDPISWE